jgi:ABC-type dipeptide/oligopeptide/nickel transport system ATPase component
MNIQSLIYQDKAIEWKLELMTFKRLTLLVGSSGVGKTQILKSILNLKKIARGTSLNGLEWHIKFSTKTGHFYEWQGCFENKGFLQNSIFGSDYRENEKNLPTIDYEKLVIDENLVIDRSGQGIRFNGVKTVKLPQTESVISLLKEEDQLKEAYEEFGRILFNDNNDSEIRRLVFEGEIGAKLKKYTTLESIRNSDESLKTKLYLSYLNARKTYDEIKAAFIEIFPYVKDVKVELLSTSDERIQAFRETPVIQIKEKGVNNWIDDRSISSGMYRTLMHISALYLCADGTLILIDEFENSLGINCIDELTTSLVSSRRNLQFILTSHHPYIINNISFNNWKLITRKAGVVKSYDATELQIGKSKHKAFTQLINIDVQTDTIPGKG